MTRRKLGRIKADAPDERRAEKYLLWLSGWRLYHEPETLPALDSATLFGNERPLEIDVGCGTGEFLISLAREDPDANFVGIELHQKSLYRAVELCASEDLDNILFVSADFNLVYPLLAPESLRAVYLRFPDPGMKRRYHKRRIFSETFLSELNRALVPGGRISVMSDHEEYFFVMLDLSERDPRYQKLHRERYLMGGIENGVRSRFQRKWEDSHNREAFRLELAKRSDR